MPSEEFLNGRVLLLVVIEVHADNLRDPLAPGAHRPGQRPQESRVLSFGMRAPTGDAIIRLDKEMGAPVELLQNVAAHGCLPVPNFAAGGIATPADAALCMALGAEAIFVGSGIFKSDNPPALARAVVHATTHWDEPEEVLNSSRGLGDAMPGIELDNLSDSERLANRGW